MFHDPPYRQLLTLIAARSQQWLRNRIDDLPALDDAGMQDMGEIALAAHICTGFRGTPAPLQTFIQARLPTDFPVFSVPAWVGSMHGAAGISRRSDPACDAFGRQEPAEPFKFDLPKAEEMLCSPIREDDISEDIVDTYARVLAACYRFGAERPRFASARTYGEAFSNCLRFADWAQQERRLMPLAQMCFCLCLIDPDHDVAPMLADIITSQRPDGSFPHRIGFGSASQDGTALRPTLATLVALHTAVHRRWRNTKPPVPLAA